MFKITGLAVAIFLTIIIFAAHAATDDGAGFPQEFASAKVWNKLDDRTQEAWLGAKKSGDMSVRFDCFVRVESPFDSGDRAFLESSGLVVQTAAGTIVRGHMKAGDVPDVAKEPFVQSIKLSSPAQ